MGFRPNGTLTFVVSQCLGFDPPVTLSNKKNQYKLT